jgi:hypothetical protein
MARIHKRGRQELREWKARMRSQSAAVILTQFLTNRKEGANNGNRS